MKTLIVVENPSQWPFDIPGVEVIAAQDYLSGESYSQMRRVRVFNLCRSYGYQQTGYYVSLLAAARQHKPLPSVSAILDMRLRHLIRYVSDDLDETIQEHFSNVKTDNFCIRIYFGRSREEEFAKLSSLLFNLFEAPLLQASFVKKDRWNLQSIKPLAASEIPPEDRQHIAGFASTYLSGRRLNTPKRINSRYDVAILVNPEEEAPPSDERALKQFEKSAEQLNLGVEFIQKKDFGRLAEFDALLIRETTSVNHHTYRFARRAAAEGLIVVDDPESILKCCNKVYLAELLRHHGLPTPKTLILNRHNVDTVGAQLGLPCILKQPDSAFSQGVVKVEEPGSLRAEAERIFQKSDLVVAQEFVPTEFDWRVGIFAREALYVCKYFMARKHWQIIRRTPQGQTAEGKVTTIPVEEAPAGLIPAALEAASLIGDGLYGVDIKELQGKFYIIEINDNPNIDYGYEDAVLKEGLYLKIMEGFLNRLEERGRKVRGRG